MNCLPALVPLLAPLLFFSCRSGDSPAPSEGYRTVATVGMIADVVQIIAGDRTRVEGLIGEGVDPHLYKPTTADVKRLHAADIIFYNGLMLEGKMDSILVNLAKSGKAVHAVTAKILEDPAYLLAHGENHHDPHVWMDVAGWIRAAAGIGESLAAFDPPNAAFYQDNTRTYIDSLKELDDYARSSIASIPENQRVLVTAHDAFNYLGRAYGIEVRAIQGLSTESEAGLKDINQLVDFLVERRIPAVFVESSVSQKNISALVEGARARGHGVTIGGELFSDAMGPTGSYEGTYIGMIDHNITTITRALGGSAPEKGLHGKLAQP